MKRIVLLLAALAMLMPAAAKGPKKGTDTIYLYMKASTTEEAYDIAMKAILDKGYPIIQESSKYCSAKLGPLYAKSKNAINHNFRVNMSIYCMERKNNIVVRITGTYTSSLDNHRNEDKVSKRGMKGSIIDQVWEILYNSAQTIPHVYEEFENSEA